MTIRGEIRSEHVPQHVDALAAAGVCTDSFIAWKNSPGTCQSFIAADQILIESVGNPRCARMPAESAVGVYRVRVDLALNSRWPDFASRMISTIPLGVLAGLASISTVLPGVYRVRVDLMLNSRLPDFASRMISTILLGVLAQPVPIPLFCREFIVFVLI